MGKLNDHIQMVSRNGAEKAVPIWQIQDWINIGIFSLDKEKGNDVGYDFADHRHGVSDFNAWVDYHKKLRAQRVSSAYTPQKAPGGIAEAQFDLGRSAPVEKNVFTSVPPTKAGEESGPEVDVKDTI